MNTLGLRTAPSSKVDLPGVGELRGPSPNLPERDEPLENRKSFDKVLSDRQQPRDPKELRAEESRPRKTESQEPGKPQNTGNRARKSEKTSDRETAMLNFMDSMESEFGVTPVRMLEALATLDHEELARNPEDSATAVIENLELTSEEEPRAVALYAHFLQQWQSMPPMSQDGASQSNTPQQGLLATVPGLNGLATGEGKSHAGASHSGTGHGAPKIDANKVVSGKELSRDQLNSTIDQLNARFFMRNGSGFADDSAYAMTGSSLSPELSELNMSSAMMTATPTGDMSESSKLAKSPQDMDSLLREIAGLPPLPKSTAEASTSLKADAADAGGIGALGSGLTLGAMLGAQGRDGASSEGDDQGSDFSDLGSDQEASSTGKSLGDMDFTALVNGRDLAPKGAMAASAAAAGTSAMANEAQARGNLEALKDQTQLMIQKGGGEARMILNPEGLGEIHLKVVVNEGKVNVEIGTQNQEAKKILESTIADLKTSLSSHKLSVEGVKVDLGQTNLSDSSQRGMNFGQDMGREQARNMMNQFRNENSSRRDPFFEMSGIKAYARKRPELEPIGPASGTAPRAALAGRGERMNLVA